MKVLLLLSFFLFTGCGLLDSSRCQSIASLSRINEDPWHVNSCGPLALEKALSNLGENDNFFTLSKEIQSQEGCTRDFLSLFSLRARSITWPFEIIKVLEKRGYQIEKLTNLKNLTSQDTAIVLVGKPFSFDYHWMVFPMDKNISTFYGKETRIKMILLIKKNFFLSSSPKYH
jgi:hypothetical protein